jgi:hypothetical protein
MLLEVLDTDPPPSKFRYWIRISNCVTETHRLNLVKNYKYYIDSQFHAKKFGYFSKLLATRFRIRIRINLSCWIRIQIQEGKNDPQK